MNTKLRLLLACCFMLGQTGIAMAVTSSLTYTVSATLPAATGVSISANSINAVGTPVFTPVVGTALSFNPLAFNATNGIWLPNKYFAIDVGPSGGPGTTDVTVTYTEGSNPNSPGHGLGWKATAAFARITGATTEVLLTTTHPKKMLKDLVPEHILSSELVTNPLRIYVGVVTGGTGEPVGSEVITNVDKSGAYSGSLLISATVV